MNKKGILGITLAALLTVSSTAIIAFASQASENSTKNVVKEVSEEKGAAAKETKSEDKELASRSRTVALDIGSGEAISFPGGVNAEEQINQLNDQLQKMENGTIKATPEDIKGIENLISDINGGKVKFDYNTVVVVPNNTAKSAAENNNSNQKILNISDDQAVQEAKTAIKYYTGVDADKIINRDGLKPYITRNNSPYAWGADILVSFSSNSNTEDNIFASISAVDGKVYNVTAIIGRYSTVNIDENKVKAAATAFLKDKGFGDNFTSIEVDHEKESAGIIGAKALYEDGTEILMEFKAEDNSVVNFTHYNLKTMKFAK